MSLPTLIAYDFNFTIGNINVKILIYLIFILCRSVLHLPNIFFTPLCRPRWKKSVMKFPLHSQLTSEKNITLFLEQLYILRSKTCNPTDHSGFDLEIVAQGRKYSQIEQTWNPPDLMGFSYTLDVSLMFHNCIYHYNIFVMENELCSLHTSLRI